MWPKIKLFFHNHWNGTTKPQRFFLLSLILVLTIVPAIASANVSTFVLEIVTNLISIIVYFLGKLIAVILHCLVYVAQYNNFINEGVVREGWKVVRDICNMFFVLGLLIIAFGTVLRLQNYSGKNSLKNLIVGAVMVNFSKTICGLIIDFAQVIMLTFVNGFKDVGAGNLTQMLGLTTLFNVVTKGDKASAMDSLGVFTSYLLALVYLVIALVAILSMTIMLIQRAVMIWIYVVLSPFPYLLSALPKTGSLGSKGNQWWTEFTGLVVVGPLLAFFLWLSFFTASGTNLSSSNSNVIQLIRGEGDGGLNPNATTTIEVNAGVTESATAQSIIKFIVSIGLLFGGMKIAQQSSSMVGGTIGAGMQRLQKLQKGATKKLTNTAANTGKLVSRNALKGGGAIISGLSKNSSGTAGKTFQKIGTAASTWGNELTDARKKEKVKTRLKTLEKLGLGVGDKTMKTFKDVVDDEGFKKTANIGSAIKGTAIGTAVGLVSANPLAGLAAGMAFGGAKGILTRTGLYQKTGEKIKNAVGGSKMSAYQKNYQDYDKDIKDADQNLNTNRTTAKEKYESAKKTAASAYQNDNNRQKYQTALTDAKKTYDLDQKEARRNYRLDRQSAKNKLHGNILNTAGKDGNEFLNGAQNNKGEWTVIGTNELRSRYDANRVNILQNPDLTSKQQTEQLKDLEKNYQKDLKNHYKNYKTKKTFSPSRILGYMNGAKVLNDFGDKMEKYHPMQLTSDAAESHLKDIKNAKTAVSDYAKDAKLTGKDFSGGTRRGLTNFQEKFLGELSNSSNPDSRTARESIKNQVDKLDGKNKDDQKTIESIMSGIANFEKKGNSTASFKDIIDTLDKQSGGKKYKDILASIKLRQVSNAAITGDGSKALKVNSFATGKHQANIIGVDFNKLNSIKDSVDTPEITAGVNIASSKMAEVSKELTSLIDEELKQIDSINPSINTKPLAEVNQRINQLRAERAAAFKSSDQSAITKAQNSTPELEQLSRSRDLRQAKERLANPENLANLSLKNTGVSLVSAKESQTTNLHEALHGFGVDNEKLTESIAKAMANGSYKIDDTATIAQNILSTAAQKNVAPEQLSSADITKAIADIKPISSAEQVIAKENGDTIINNTTINNINNINNNSDASEKTLEKLNKIEMQTDERQRFEDSRYFVDKEKNKEKDDKLNKFIKDFDNKQ